jgi:DNA-binding MarR family transcriptional regulator
MGTHASAEIAARQVLDSLRRIVQALRESSRRAEQELGVSGAQLFVLDALALAPALSLNDLARRTRTHQSSVSTVVARLVKRGLIRRARADEDGRRVTLALSPDGRRLVARAPDVAQNRLLRGIDRLAPASRRALAGALATLADHVDGGRCTPQMFFDSIEQKGRRARG